MLIVLEGCDGTGKTTLANNIAKVTGADIIHCTALTPNNYKFFSQIIEMSRMQDIIADRFMYGQFVYQDEKERKDRDWLNKYSLRMLELDMMNAGARVFNVVAPVEEIKRRLTARGEAIDWGIEKVLTGFASVFSESLLPIRVIDPTKEIW